MSHSAKKIASAMGWNLAFVLVTAGAQILTTMLLGRLLSPSDYGVFAFANAIVVFGMHLSQRGLATAILRQLTLSPTDIGNAYIVASLVSIALGGLTVLGSIALRTFGGGALDQQTRLLLFMAIPVIFQLIATPAASLLQRDLATVKASVVSVAGILIGNGLTAATLAFYGFGPWSLALGAAANALVTLLMNHWFARASVRFRWESSEIRRLLREAIAMNGLRALDVAWVQLPLVIFGLRAPSATAGIYQRSQFVADILLQMTVGRLSAVLYAALAARGEGQSTSNRMYRLTFTFLSALVFPIVGFVFAASDNVLGVLLGPAWTSGAWTLRLLIVAFGIWTVNQAAGMMLELRARFADRYICSAAAAASLLLCIAMAPPDNLVLMSLPAVFSMLFTAIVVHVRAGETLRTAPQLLALLGPGLTFGLTSFIGAMLGGKIAVELSLPLYFWQLLLQGCGACLLSGLAAIPIMRLPQMQPFLGVLDLFAPNLRFRLRLGRATP